MNPSGGYRRHEYPPLGLMYIASYSRKAGHTVDLYDEGACAHKNKTLVEYAEAYEPEVIGFSLFTTKIYNAYQKISLLKEILPSCVIVAGGPHATVLPEKTLSECKEIDFLVKGEGEITFVELLQALQGRMPLDGIRGLFYRENGRIVSNPDRELIKDLDAIPFPEYDIIDRDGYLFDAIRVGNKTATIMASRGCPYSCTFCAAKAVWQKSFRRRSPRNVVDEMLWLAKNYGYDEIYFMDDMFATNKKWLEEFYGLMRDHGISLPWKCLGRVDSLRYEDYVKMARNGCYLLQFGVESGDNNVLTDIKKKIVTSQARKAFRDAHRAGLNTYGFFILGHRLDTFYTIAKTINFAKSLNPDFISFFSLVPFPGTEVYSYAPEDIRYDWHKYMYMGWDRESLPIQISEIPPQDLIVLEKYAFSSFFVSISYITKNILFHRRAMGLRWLKIQFLILQLLTIISLYIRNKSSIDKLPKDLSGHIDSVGREQDWKDILRIPTDALRSDYDRHLRTHHEFIEYIERKISSSNPKSVLEVGCGAAIASHHLSCRFPAVDFTSVDSSPVALDAARHIGGMSGSTIDIRRMGEPEKMEFQDGSFDLIFSEGFLNRVKNIRSAIQEQSRVLTKQGVLVVDLPRKYHPNTIRKRRKIRKGIWDHGWETEYSLPDIHDIAAELDLKIIDVFPHGKTSTAWVGKRQVVSIFKRMGSFFQPFVTIALQKK